MQSLVCDNLIIYLNCFVFVCNCFQFALLVLLVIIVRSISMTVPRLCAITTVLVLTSLVTTVVAVDQDGLADCVIPSWDLYAMRLLTITLMSARMEVFVATLLTKTTTHVLVLQVSLDVTVNLNLTLVIVHHVSKMEHVLSLDLVISNVIVQKVRLKESKTVNLKYIHNCVFFTGIYLLLGFFIYYLI